jgi:F-type H+-transporting ATPase subunit a
VTTPEKRSPKKRGCLGCSFPVLIIVIVVFLAIVVMGFLSGALGQKLVGEISWLNWMSVDRPSPHLPAPVLFHVLGLGVTNTMLAGWITVIFLVLVSWLITRRMQLIPKRVQSAFEALVGWVFDFCRNTAGEKNARKFFPVVGTIFLFVAFNAWLSLIPGYGSIEYIKYEPIPAGAEISIIPAAGDEPEQKLVMLEGKEHEIVLKDGREMVKIEEELIRGANTDVNTPLAMAIISFIFVTYFGLKELKLKYLEQYFNFKPLFKSIGGIFKGKFDLLGVFQGVINVFVGLLEFLSRFITIISFTFRLFGNMTAGEILLLVTAYLVPWVLALPFYGLELLIGFIQGLIFAGLTLVFATMAVASHSEEAAH